MLVIVQYFSRLVALQHLQGKDSSPREMYTLTHLSAQCWARTALHRNGETSARTLLTSSGPFGPGTGTHTSLTGHCSSLFYPTTSVQKHPERGTRSLIHTYCSCCEIEKFPAPNPHLLFYGETEKFPAHNPHLLFHGKIEKFPALLLLHSCRTVSLSRQGLYPSTITHEFSVPLHLYCAESWQTGVK